MKDRKLEIKKDSPGGDIRGRNGNREPAKSLGRSVRTVERYRRSYLLKGPDALKDRRCSNYRKLKDKQEKLIP